MHMVESMWSFLCMLTKGVGRGGDVNATPARPTGRQAQFRATVLPMVNYMLENTR